MRDVEKFISILVGEVHNIHREDPEKKYTAGELLVFVENVAKIYDEEMAYEKEKGKKKTK